MNLLHILAGCFYRLAQGVYTSRIFTDYKAFSLGGWLLTTFGRPGFIQQEYSLLSIAWLLWLEQTAYYSRRSEKADWALHQIRSELLHFTWHGMAFVRAAVSLGLHMIPFHGTR